jgi:RNA polymerase sigma-70 factor (ECF subfamily)
MGEPGERGERDREWLQRWRQGDPLAFEQLVRHWQGPVSRLLGRLVPAGDQIPDLCQEVFLRVYQARDRFRGEAAFSTWLYRIAVNIARDTARRRSRDLIPLADSEPVDHRESGNQSCLVRETTEQVARAVAELPGPQREALVLRHYEQISFEEMARITGTPASTLKSRFSAALIRLRMRLEELGFGPEELP